MLAALALWGAATLASASVHAEPHRTPAARAQGKHFAQKPKAPAAPKGGPAKSAPKKGAGKPSKRPQESRKPSKKAGSEPKPADPQAREGIAGQPVVEPNADTPELREMREVEDVLFWDMSSGPAAAPTTDGPDVVASGLPPSPDKARGGASAPVMSQADIAGSDLRWMAELNKPDLPFRWDVRLIRYLDYFKNNPRGRSFVATLLKRLGRYEAKIRETLKAKGLPEDLVYLALVESGMNPRIVSHAGAAGLWQFMPKAADAYGLRNDKWVDERLDPQRSTIAATRFLKDLHSRFGRWELAMAAYNMGHGGLLTAIRKYNTNDYWELSQLEAGVPFETALYVPKIIAIAFVAHNREVFGCKDLEPDPAEPFDSAPAPAPKGKPVSKKVASAPAKSPDPPLPLPVAVAPAAPAEAPVETELYTLRWGESLEAVAGRFGMTESKLRALNDLKDPVPPRPGALVKVPKSHGAPSLGDPAVAVVPVSAVEPAGKKRVFYEVVWGDRLDDVARVLGVSSDELCQWNNLDRTANLHGKMVLQAYVGKDQDLSNVRVLSPSETRILVVGTPEFFDYYESKNGRARTVIVAEKGDTLRSLSKKHGISVGMLERINHRSREIELQPGETIVVYKKRTQDATASLSNKGVKGSPYDDDKPSAADLD